MVPTYYQCLIIQLVRFLRRPWRRHLRFLHKAQEAGEDAVQKEANRRNDSVCQSALGKGAVEVPFSRSELR